MQQILGHPRLNRNTFRLYNKYWKLKSSITVHSNIITFVLYNKLSSSEA